MTDHDYEDLLHEEQRRRKLHNKLMHLPPGHPDEGDIEDALEECEDE